MRGRLFASAMVCTALGACASAQAAGDAPTWFAEREGALQEGFPSLQSVPRTHDANTDPAYWEDVQEDLVAAGAEVRANPRSQPATAAEDPNLFLEEARRLLEQARLAHEPN